MLTLLKESEEVILSNYDNQKEEEDIINKAFSQKINRRPNLRFLSLGELWVKKIPKFINFLDVSKITYIRLYKINRDLIILLGKNCCQLRGLRIGEPYSPPTISDKQIFYISKHMSRITQLFLRDQKVTQAGAKIIIKNMLQLQTLDLGNNIISKNQQNNMKSIYKGNMIWF